MTTSETTSETKISGEKIEKKVPTKWRARRFMLELNQLELYPKLKANLTSRRTFRFMIVGKEIAPDTGREHYHIYVEFRLQTILTPKTVCNCHVDIPASKDQAYDYCTKDCEIVEKVGEESHQGAKYTFQQFKDMADPSELPVHYFKTWTLIKQYNQSMTRAHVYKPGIIVHYIWGDSGVGKTKKVYDMVGEEPFDRVKFTNNFWIGVSTDPNVKVAWYDDFRDSDMKPSEFINFIDYYANDMNIKGGHVINHYYTIYITSIQSPDELYRNMTLEEPRKQWMRRLNVIHLE